MESTSDLVCLETAISYINATLGPHLSHIGGGGGGGRVVRWSWVNFQCRGVLLIRVGQGPTALAVGAGGGCLDIFSLIYPSSFFFSLSLGDDPT